MAAVRKVPMRKCVGCGEMKEKKKLIRVVRMPDGRICLDSTGKMNGRGAYLCKDGDCLKKAVKGKSLERAFSSRIPDEVYERLEKEMSGLEQ